MHRIAELAALIQQRTAEIDAYLQENNLPQPSFEEDASSNHNLTNKEIVDARDDLLSATLELHDLILGPAMCLRPMLNGVSLQAVYKYNIPEAVPIHGEISFSELAKRTGLREYDVRRILRHAMVFHHVFQEPREGFVAHTAASRRLRDDPDTMAGLGYFHDELWPSFAHTLPALEKSQGEEPNETGWSQYHGVDKPFYEHYVSHPAMAKRFRGAMAALADADGTAPEPLADAYPWGSIGGAGDGTGTVVDVGGGKGHISVMLATRFPSLHFVVQDTPSMIAGAAAETLAGLPADVSDRIKFTSHDFFTDQPAEADVYLLRNIIHNWSDAYAVRIMRALIPALRTGSRIVIHDRVLPPPGTMHRMKERAIREMDLWMLTLCNSREREEADWIALFAMADPRFVDARVKMWTPAGAAMSIIEIVWPGDGIVARDLDEVSSI
ncbi:uncharacterized protein DSM5745_05164 [Aspergillus mulundensis]|uniref:O-methyltransferase C-terminal domain-containing protein n=1 Tax=Aspergillus mulundensis TaxID=1810919 RepID=A0A3D8S5L9_9EURO|nr:hypothetical protein DSM5745_05164 [Aspergillus mulundensis]RDW81607.1 hypothetical protein DSM5745_05164 [Aspergillus mulundensis]